MSSKIDVWTLNLISYNWTTDDKHDKTKARRGHLSVLYNGQMVVFGGFASGYENDVWTFNLTSHEWTRLTTSATKPSVRWLHSSVLYHGQMVMFGGLLGLYSSNTNDVWALNLTSYNWAELTTSTTKPSARNSHPLILHNGQMVLFGGEGDCGGTYNNDCGGSYKNDVWTLQLELSTATTRAPTTTTHAPTTTTPTTTTFTNCPIGTFNDQQNCIPWTNCTASQRILRNGTDTVDRQCEKCPRGTFSASNNSFQCTTTSCDSCGSNWILPDNPWLFVILILLLALFMFVFIKSKQKHKRLTSVLPKDMSTTPNRAPTLPQRSTIPPSGVYLRRNHR